MSTLEKFQNKKFRAVSHKEMKSVKGGLLGLLCIEGVLDGIPGNTKIYFGKCR
jgi:hypothetical protein